MFKSANDCIEFHMGLRAICGGPVHLSYMVGGHDYDRTKKPIFPNGTIPRCQHFALPTKDCMFKNTIVKPFPRFGTQTRTLAIILILIYTSL